jgi:hypothetical protein
MTVEIQTDSCHALTAPSITRMISLTYMFLVNFVATLVCVFAYNNTHKGAMEFIGHLAGEYGH